MPRVTHTAEAMPRSGIRAIMDLAWSLDQPVIGLHVGEPSFDAPDHVVEAARRAYADGHTHYVPNAGIDALRTAIAAKITNLNGYETTPEQVTVSAGGAQALHLALSLTIGAGDEVLVPDPGWPNFAMSVELLQAKPVLYPLRPERSFRPDIDDLEQLVTERTKVLIVNTPSNPLGNVLDAASVESLVRFAERHDLWVLSDECYDALTFEPDHISPGRFDTDGRVLSAYSFSKTFAMTGVRVGYLRTPLEVAPTAAKLQEPMLACVNAPAQYAALAALEGTQAPVDEMRAAYASRRDAATERLDELGMGYLRPEGAFYLWIDVRDRVGDDTERWALSLLRERSVAVAPGTVFGPSGAGWARVSLASDTDALLEGLSRIGDHR
ncbi:aminotransferase class I/II-fold pyridoxal phosphate-dependent enzyme [Nocardioidaceae bacterium SCSIO 66511]|nr:aminotransferase class I/II-fold pyridoxal phosphate-dependent enzyme [Nocardioidaceae bacterium SCSIO 66511]